MTTRVKTQPVPRQHAIRVDDAVAIGAAVADGLLSIIHRLKPSYAPRLRAWFNDVVDQYQVRRDRDGTTEARTWLLAELRAARLPDRRTTPKTAEADQQLRDRYDLLKTRLTPIFRATRSTFQRRQRAAPIVSLILGKTVRPDDLQTPKNLSEFCHAVLGTNAVQMSRVRRRLRDFARALAADTLNRLDAWAAVESHRAPGRAGRIRAVSTKLSDEVARRYGSAPHQ